MYVGAGLWQNLDSSRIRGAYGAVFVRSITCRLPPWLLRYGTRESAAVSGERYLRAVRADAIGSRRSLGVWEAKRHRVDGGLSLRLVGQRMVERSLRDEFDRPDVDGSGQRLIDARLPRQSSCMACRAAA